LPQAVVSRQLPPPGPRAAVESLACRAGVESAPASSAACPGNSGESGLGRGDPSLVRRTDDHGAGPYQSLGTPPSPQRPRVGQTRLRGSLLDRLRTWTMDRCLLLTSMVAIRINRPDSIRFRSDQMEVRPEAQAPAKEATQWCIA